MSAFVVRDGQTRRMEYVETPWGEWHPFDGFGGACCKTAEPATVGEWDCPVCSCRWRREGDAKSCPVFDHSSWDWAFGGRTAA